MKQYLRHLGKDAIVYGIGGFLAKAVSFLLLPIYTRLFDPAEYGTIEMLVVRSSFLSSVLVMGMDTAQFFFFFQQRADGKAAEASLITLILQWRLAMGPLIAIVAVGVSPLPNSFFFQGQLTLMHFAIAFAGVFFVVIMNQSVGLFRLLYQPWQFFAITLAIPWCRPRSLSE